MSNQKRLEMDLLNSNNLLIKYIKSNIEMQQIKLSTLNGSIEELITTSSQFSYDQQNQLIYNALPIFTEEQINTLKEICSVIESACPFTIQNRSDVVDDSNNQQCDCYEPYQEFQSLYTNQVIEN